MYRYLVIQESFSTADAGAYRSFSIRGWEKTVDDWLPVAALSDVSVSADVALRIARLLNAGQVQPSFLLPFVSTFLDSN